MENTSESTPLTDPGFLSETTVLLFGALVVLLYALTWCRIYSKAGFHPGLGLLMLVPGINLIAQAGLAFGTWPVERELRGFRKVRKTVHRADERVAKAA